MSSLLLGSAAGTQRAKTQQPIQQQQSQQRPPGVEHHTDATTSLPPSIPLEDPSSSSPASPPSLWYAITNPSSNPLLSAGASLMIFGAALSLGRKGLMQGASLMQRRMLVSLEVPSKDKAHGWLLTWMEEQARRGRELPQLTGVQSLMDIVGVRRSRGGVAGQEDLPPPVRIHSRDLAVQTTLPSASTSQAQQQAMTISGQPLAPSSSSPGTSRNTKAQFSLVPGPGTHWFRYHGAWIRLQRERNGKLIDFTTGAPWETLTLTTLFSSRDVFPRLLAEAQQMAVQSIEGKTIIYTAWGVEWRAFGQPRKVRELDSVVLSVGQRSRIEEDVKSFLGRGAWYARRGIPYRRGYLLHGSPGSGKTSIIQALAGALDLNICLLNLSERGLTDDKLNHLLSLAPERSILLLEDIDAAFPSRSAGEAEEPKKEYQTSVTFSGLLNALDGVASGESRIVMMTTNHVERLDPALIRPGRVDLIEELGDADEGMVQELFERFYGTLHGEGGAADAKPATGTGVADVLPGSAEIEDASPARRASHDLSSEEMAHLTTRLTKAVEVVSQLRRRELNLDPSGRFPLGAAPVTSPSASFPLNSSTPASQVEETGETVTPTAAPARKSRTKAAPLPAKRGGMSMAELQGLFIRYPSDPRGAVEEVELEAGV